MNELLWRPVPVVIWAATAALWDCRFRRLPNLLTLGGAGVAAAHLLVHGSSVLGASPLSATVAGIGALLVLLPFYRLGWLGAGDVKLMSAIGLLGGVHVMLTTFVLSSLLSLPVVLWIAIRHRWKHGTSQAGKLQLPQGAFLAVGLILTVAARIRAG